MDVFTSHFRGPLLYSCNTRKTFPLSIFFRGLDHFQRSAGTLRAFFDVAQLVTWSRLFSTATLLNRTYGTLLHQLLNI